MRGGFELTAAATTAPTASSTDATDFDGTKHRREEITARGGAASTKETSQ